MGLDMYLNKKEYVYRKKDGTFSKSMDDLMWDKNGCSNGVDMSYGIAYWRKANHIHAWFVKNVQDGEDKCLEYDVSPDKIRELIGVCKSVIDKADGVKFTFKPKSWQSIQKWAKVAKKAKDRKRFAKIKKEYVFSSKHLKEAENTLLHYDVCRSMKFKKFCEEVLPRQEGFFFGNTKYAGDYMSDTVRTYRMLKEIMKQYDADHKKKDYWDMSYRASW